MSETSQALPAPMDGAASYDNQFVTFSVEGEMFAVPMGPVQEIIRVPEVARLPLAPASLDGLANLRGRVLPIVNLRKLFGCAQRANDDASRAVVIHLGQPLGFVVDRVASVLSVEPSEVESATAIQSIVKADYLTGVIKRTNAQGQPEMLMVLDFAKLVEKEFSSLQRSVEQIGQGALHVEQGQDDAAVASDEIRLVSFSVAGQEYGIEIADVQEIVQVPERITALPTAAHHVQGLISLRQRLLPLVSLRALFGLPHEALSENHRIVVVTLPGAMTVGLVTDSVKEVLSVSRQQVEPIPGVLAQGSAMQEFSGICRLDSGKRLLSVIATQKLLGLQGVQEAIQIAAAHVENNQGDGVSSNFLEAASSLEEDMQVVIFRLGAEEFGVPIMSVQEIVRVPDLLTRVPKTPDFVEGVINLRGTVLPVMDQRTRLGLPTIERNDRQRIMVYLMGNLRTGFIVDSVAEVLRIPRAQVAPAPELSADQGRLVTHVAKLEGDKRLVMLLDPTHLLEGQEMQAVAMMAHGEGLEQEG